MRFTSTDRHCQMLETSKVFVAGRNGLVGSTITRRLRELGNHNLLLWSRSQLDLSNQTEVDRFFEAERPEFVFLAAAKVGGISGQQHLSRGVSQEQSSDSIECD